MVLIADCSADLVNAKRDIAVVVAIKCMQENEQDRQRSRASFAEGNARCHATRHDEEVAAVVDLLRTLAHLPSGDCLERSVQLGLACV